MKQSKQQSRNYVDETKCAGFNYLQKVVFVTDLTTKTDIWISDAEFKAGTNPESVKRYSFKNYREPY